jgi:hypothetical protein
MLLLLQNPIKENISNITTRRLSKKQDQFTKLNIDPTDQYRNTKLVK